jgi:glycine C-acetyltransferase
MDSFGFGLSSVRFICGTQSIHKELEDGLSRFFGTEDTILYSSCFDANGGLFETITGEEDVIISDALNHASIIDGIRLSKAERLRYANNDLEELERHLVATQHKRIRLVATDGVFSMDGSYAKLDRVAALCEQYRALLMVDDSHATGFVGPTGRGTPELFGVMSKVDVMTSTLGKALGGASGGFTTGKREIIQLLRQRSRPYLFSNTLAPPRRRRRSIGQSGRRRDACRGGLCDRVLVSGGAQGRRADPGATVCRAQRGRHSRVRDRLRGWP